MPPLVAVALAWVAGLIVAHHVLAPVGVKPLSLALLGLVPLTAILVWRRDRSLVLSGACALAFIVGAIRYQTGVPHLEDPAFVAHHNDRGWATLQGVVQGYPDVRDTRTDLKLDTEWIEIDGQVHEVHGTVLVRAPAFHTVRYGDQLRVSGLLETPPDFEDFSYREYLARKNIHSVMDYAQIERLATDQGRPFWAATFALKDRASDAIGRLIPDPEASLLQGILLGIRAGIPEDLYDTYNATGTSHIIVISGANILIVVALFSRSFGRLLGRRRAYWFTMVGLIFYVMLVGADPVVIRAGVMGGLFVTAVHLGRRSTAYVSLLASVLFLTAINPFTLWDVGFQLSFAATLGLILFTPVIERLCERALTRVVSRERARELVRYLNDVLIVTLAAQILTLPLILHTFRRLSLVSPLANLFILPVQPPIMISGGIAVLAGLIPFLEPVARVPAWVAWLCLAYTNAVVRSMAAWPFASLQIGHASSRWLLAGYGLVLGTVWAVRHRQGVAGRLWRQATSRAPAKMIVGVMLLAFILIWLAVLQLPDGHLHVAFLDVGQGDAILITTPQGRQILVDGGPGSSALTSALGQRMPFWDRSIDLVVLTHADTDHISGLVEVLQRYDVGGWLDSGLPADDPAYLQCQALLDNAHVPHHAVRIGDSLDLGRGVAIDVLHPQRQGAQAGDAQDNDNSVVLKLTWNQTSFLLTGDLEAQGESELLQSGHSLAADVLKVGHHGSGGSSSPQFLAAVAPNYAVISVGADNRFGHPDPEVLDRLADVVQVTVLRTDEQGSVEAITDGTQIWIKTQR
jgi:competence protein ComEC